MAKKERKKTETGGEVRDRLLAGATRLFASKGYAATTVREIVDAARVMYSIYYGPPQGAPFVDFDAYHHRFQEAVLQIVREGVRSGEFRRVNLNDAVWAVMGPLNVAMEVELCHPPQGIGRDGVRRVLELVLEGIATDRKADGENGRKR